jgi:hypothetical protein
MKDTADGSHERFLQAADLKTTPPPLGLFIVTNPPMRKAAPVEGQ